MRLALSVVGLLIVAYVVLTLTKRQAQSLLPQAPRTAASGAASAASPAAATVPQQVQQDVQKLLEQGAQRASEAAQ